MKRSRIILQIVSSVVLTCFDCPALSGFMSKEPPLAKVVLKVVDQDGSPVAGARVFGGYTRGNRMRDSIALEGMTDGDGLFVAEGRCDEFLRYEITKAGYYTTDERLYFVSSKSSYSAIDGKWQPYGEAKTVTLKRIKDPYAVKVFGGKLCSSVIPAFGEWLPFDMELSDWLPPHGRGVHSDVLLRFEKQIGEKWYEFSYSMEASFTNNPCAGVYCKALDAYSDLKTDYVADTNASYSASYRYSIESGGGKPVKINGCPNDSYLVFRTRTKLDANGKLVSAHYGKYCGVWRSDKDRMHHGEGCFNPKANDPNIEGEQRLHYAIKNYRKAK